MIPVNVYERQLDTAQSERQSLYRLRRDHRDLQKDFDDLSVGFSNLQRDHQYMRNRNRAAMHRATKLHQRWIQRSTRETHELHLELQQKDTDLQGERDISRELQAQLIMLKSNRSQSTYLDEGLTDELIRQDVNSLYHSIQDWVIESIKVKKLGESHSIIQP